MGVKHAYVIELRQILRRVAHFRLLASLLAQLFVQGESRA